MGFGKTFNTMQEVVFFPLIILLLFNFLLNAESYQGVEAIFCFSFDELLELSQRGDNRTIDMLVGDIYGGMDYSKVYLLVKF